MLPKSPVFNGGRQAERASHYGSNDGNDEDNKTVSVSVELADRAITRTHAPGAAGRQVPDDKDCDAILRRKLDKARRKKDLATFRLAQMNEQGGDAAKVRRELQGAIEAVTELLLISDPGQQLDQVMSPGTRDLRNIYMQKLGAFEASAKAGWGKHGWNLAAGGIGNALCFGIGGTMAILSGSAAVGLVVNMVAWTFAEPLLSMLRATTVTNPCLDHYMARQRLQARAAREWLDGTSTLVQNRKFPWEDRATGEVHWLNAAEWLNKTSWLGLWSGKYLTDDIPYYGYSVANGIVNLMPEIAGAHLYNTATSMGLMTNIGSRVGAGIAAGALIHACVQWQRAVHAGQTGGTEVATRTMSLWREEAAYLASLLNDIDDKRNAPTISRLEQEALVELRHSIQLWHDKATAKSGRCSSILYEWRAMLQSKREAMGIDREVPGKRLDTAASFLGKGLCQVAGVTIGMLGAAAAKSTTPWVRWAGYLVSPLAAIGAGGFIIRRELEVASRVMFGAAQGVVNCCRCRKPQEE
jgi:hypothetical protein